MHFRMAYPWNAAEPSDSRLDDRTAGYAPLVCAFPSGRILAANRWDFAGMCSRPVEAA